MPVIVIFGEACRQSTDGYIVFTQVVSRTKINYCLISICHGKQFS